MKTLAQRFWEKVVKTDFCWVWAARLDPQGYGRFRVLDKMQKASRVAWELTHGSIPKGEGAHGICVCHKCDNPKCVNPDHLFLGTHKENMEDCKSKGRYKNTPQIGMSAKNAKLTDLQVYEIRLLAGTMRQIDIAKRYNINQPTVSRIILRQSWRHLSE